jgi:hypothetical protein
MRKSCKFKIKKLAFQNTNQNFMIQNGHVCKGYVSWAHDTTDNVTQSRPSQHYPLETHYDSTVDEPEWSS